MSTGTETPPLLSIEWANNLQGIISLRGAKLTFRDDCYLWVVMAGEKPRAWRLRVDHRCKATGRWRERRPPLKKFFWPQEVITAARRELLRELRFDAVTVAKIVPHVPSNYQMEQQRRYIRTIIKLRWLERWLAHFPHGATEFVLRHGFHERQWHLLNLWLRVPQGRELFEELPALAWMLASSWCYKTQPVQRPLRSIRALVTRPRRHLLRWLDLPCGEATLRLLKPFSGAELNLRVANAMCRVLRHDDKRRWWLNLPHKADYSQLCILAYDQPISFELLRVINASTACQGTDPNMSLGVTYQRTVRLLHDLHDEENLEALRRIRSVARLQQLHDELDRVRQALQTPSLGFTLEPPLEPPAWLEPIRDSDNLRHEARVMRHCADSFAAEIACGQCYLYAVHHPLARATLSIRPLAEDRWALSQLQGACNSEVPSAVRAAVKVWLQQAKPRAGFGDEVRRLITGSIREAEEKDAWRRLEEEREQKQEQEVHPHHEVLDGASPRPEAEAPPCRPFHHPDQRVFDFELPYLDVNDKADVNWIPF